MRHGKRFCTCIENTTTLGILREMNLSNLKVLKNSVLKKILRNNQYRILIFFCNSTNFTALRIPIDDMTLVGRYKVDYRIFCKNTFVSLGVGLVQLISSLLLLFGGRWQQNFWLWLALCHLGKTWRCVKNPGIVCKKRNIFLQKNVIFKDFFQAYTMYYYYIVTMQLLE